jgi:hypothetical protein
MEARVDFIERIFGVSPDGGSGALELLYCALAFIAAATASFAFGARDKKGSGSKQVRPATLRQ